MLTEAEYLDAERFPLSTQKGLNYQDQAMIDALNLDDLREAVLDGKTLTDREKARLAELELKQAGAPDPE